MSSVDIESANIRGNLSLSHDNGLVFENIERDSYLGTRRCFCVFVAQSILDLRFFFFLLWLNLTPVEVSD